MLLAGAGGLVSPEQPASAAGPSASALPPPDTIAAVGQLQNPHFAPMSGSNGTTYTTVIPDVQNHLLVFFNIQDQCTHYITEDYDTGATVGPISGGKLKCNPTMQFGNSIGSATTFATQDAVIDPQDQLLLGPSANRTGILVASERTLGILGTWPIKVPTAVPSNLASTTVLSTSWYPTGDQIIVLTDQRVSGGTIPNSFAVTAYSAKASLAAGHAVMLWTTPVSDCYGPVYGTFVNNVAQAYHATSEAAVYVPCDLSGLVAGEVENIAGSGVVKVELGSKDAAGKACAAPATECPDGVESAAVSPGPLNDSVFEAGSDRLIFPQAQGTVTMLIYQGHPAGAGRGSSGTFVGSAEAGSDSHDEGRTGVGIDPSSGRMYLDTPTLGMTAVDARRTPLSPGLRFPVFNKPGAGSEWAVLPADAGHPYRRILANLDPDYDVLNATGHLPAFTVLADTTTVTQDPPVNSVDANTIHGPVAPGSTVSAVYGATGRGFGFHSDFVGGTTAAVSNLAAQQPIQLPFGQSSDLMGAAVVQLSSRDHRDLGDASSLADGTGTSASSLNECTGVTSLQTCVGRPDCTAGDGAVPCEPIPGLPVPSGAPSPPATSQTWPFQDAVCPNPDGTAKATQGGWYANGSAVPGSSSFASATADCSSEAPLSAGAVLQGSQVGAGAPVFTVAHAATRSSLTAPRADGPVSVTTEASSGGIDIALPGHTLSLSNVLHKATAAAGGKPGTTSVTDVVQIDGASLDGTALCTSTCDAYALRDQLNAIEPSRFYVVLPEMDARYANGCTGDRYRGGVTCQGSPGGYLSAVQSTLGQQYGDQQFNSMTEEESTILPAIRFIVFDWRDGAPTRAREITDLAGAEVDAERGFTVIPPPTSGELDTVQLSQALQDSGVPTTLFVPGTPGHHTPGTAGDILRRVVSQVLSGIGWLLRSPLAALQMFGLWLLLGLPIVMSRRRWTWFVYSGVNRVGPA